MAVLRALDLCGALDDRRAAAGILAYAERASTPEGLEEIDWFRDNQPGSRDQLPEEVFIGLLYAGDATPSDEAAGIVIGEMARLEAERSAVARIIAESMRKWDLAAVRAWLLERIESGPAGAEDLLPLLERRDSVARENQERLGRWLRGGGQLAGLAAVLLADGDAQRDLLGGEDRKALAALLASAPLVRESLPVEEVGRWLKDPEATIARAASRYLETEDSIAARALLRAGGSGAPRILGYRPPPARAEGAMLDMTFEVWEALLREDVLRPKGPSEVHALLSRYLIHDVAVFYAKEEHLILRIWDDRATLTTHREESGETEREIPPEAVRSFKEFLSREEIADLPSLIAPRVTGPEYEYLQLDRTGGRRTVIRAFEGGTVGSAYGRLKTEFRRLRDAAGKGPAFRTVPPWA
jgi:hypothetical protein